MKLSNQAIGSLMMIIQNAIFTGADCTEQMRALEIVEAEDEETGELHLVVTNPPFFSFAGVGIEQEEEIEDGA